MPRPTSSTRLLLDEQLFHPGQRVAVAVSGGADSVALLRTLLARQHHLGLVLSIAHVHHGIRGPQHRNEADRDQAFVEALASAHRLPLHLRRVDTPSHALTHNETLEEAARNLRYAFFHQLIRQGSVDVIATAHTLDDQAETVLQKLIRGAWTEGLGAISPSLEGKVLRPLLNTTRSDIEAALRILNQPWCEDGTNQDADHTRNRIRHELLPVLRTFNPRIAAQLSRTAAIARDEEVYWQREIARIGPSLVLPGKPVRGGGRSSSTHPEEGSIALELERLRSLGPALQRRLLRWSAQQLHCPLDFHHTEALMQLCGFLPSALAPRRLDLDHRVYAQRTAREIQFIRTPPPIPAHLPLQHALPVPGEVSLPELGLKFITRLLPGQPSPPAALIRTVKPGDRVTPRYSSGPKKIKDVLERLHLPAAEREKCPAVVWPDTGKPGTILWLQGIELDPSSLPILTFALEVVPI